MNHKIIASDFSPFKLDFSPIGPKFGSPLQGVPSSRGNTLRSPSPEFSFTATSSSEFGFSTSLFGYNSSLLTEEDDNSPFKRRKSDSSTSSHSLYSKQNLLHDVPVGDRSSLSSIQDTCASKSLRLVNQTLGPIEKQAIGLPEGHYARHALNSGAYHSPVLLCNTETGEEVVAKIIRAGLAKSVKAQEGFIRTSHENYAELKQIGMPVLDPLNTLEQALSSRVVLFPKATALSTHPDELQEIGLMMWDIQLKAWKEGKEVFADLKPDNVMTFQGKAVLVDYFEEKLDRDAMSDQLHFNLGQWKFSEPHHTRIQEAIKSIIKTATTLSDDW